MPRPSTKEELIQASNENFAKLFKLIDSFSDEELNGKFSFEHDLKLKEAHWKRDKNIKDVLVHLYEWHKLLMNWLNKNLSNESVHFLSEPYTWKSISKMNESFWELHQKTSLDVAVKMLHKSHEEVMQRLQSLTNDQLFTKKYYPWTGTTTLGSYCISSTSSHYDWACKKLRKYKSMLKKA